MFISAIALIVLFIVCIAFHVYATKEFQRQMDAVVRQHEELNRNFKIGE